ncbi:hypothetical protein COLO4_05813 [Corchorus olitorius]|uniref:Uncharacterized protein n=1 Tax=Corchorus olitorius TaxID=93759 RepID=A0A1R3KPT1_9ROSI|nr:hypothetical protein COLO4_05813 [Corchorus olitorius]
MDSSMGRMQSSIEKLTVEMHRFIESSFKRIGEVSGSRLEANSIEKGKDQNLRSVENTLEMSSQSRTFTKRSKLECPRFERSDFFGWHSKIIQFFAADATAE